jgi:hypothetical protein
MCRTPMQVLLGSCSHNPAARYPTGFISARMSYIVARLHTLILSVREWLTAEKSHVKEPGY